MVISIKNSMFGIAPWKHFFYKGHGGWLGAFIIMCCCLFWMLCPGITIAANEVVATISYHIGVNDVVRVSVIAGGEKQMESELVVSNNGKIKLPLIGNIHAAGLTARELEKNITVPLQKDYFIDPGVSVRITGFHSLRYFVSGAVGKPGYYEMSFHATFIDLMAKAGGISPERGNIAYIFRGDQKDLPETIADLDAMDSSSATTRASLTVDLHKLFDLSDMSANISLETGDRIYIPFAKSLDMSQDRIYVEGEVASPGFFNYQPGMTASSICLTAGGLTDVAAPNRTKIIRKTADGNEVIKIKLGKIQKGEAPDIPMKPGDRMYVPESWF